MKVHFSHATSGQNARALMLAHSLRTLFTKDAGVQVIDGAAEDTASRLFRDLPAFPPAPGASAFVGLVNLPAEMLGRNWVICTRPLSAELADFAARNGLDAENAAGWALPLLKNFEAVIFADIAPFNASKGYTPWVPLQVAPNLPVDVVASTSDFSKARIALICHQPVADDASLNQRLSALGEVTVVTAQTPAVTARDALSTANMHVHLGYSPQAEVTGMSPFDSAMNRIYTVLVGDGPDEPAQFGEYISNVMATRTYCSIAHSPAGAIDICQTMIDRFSVMARNNFRINPELAAYGRDNGLQRSKSLRRFQRFIEND